MNQTKALDQFCDPIWRIRNLYKIVDKRGKTVQFEPNDAQLEFLNSCGKRDLILKARQLGFTTLLCIVGLDEALFNDNWNVCIIAHRMDDAKKIFSTKIKYPYDKLPDQLKAARPLLKDSADSLLFNNNSTIVCTPSARSGTLQRLHISEFGKICAQFPHKAREIITGSLPAAENGAVTIESTAEGQDGAFYQYVQQARTREGKAGLRDWRFHFYAWWMDRGNRLPADTEVITKESQAYFATLEHEHKIILAPEQKAWWVATERNLGGDMKRENPATPDEAFEQAIEGAYFSSQLAYADKQGLIGRFPYDPRFPVNTFWDLGRNDMNTIWFHQRVGERNRFINYYENSGEHLSHYTRYLKEFERDTGCQWGDHYWPHDGKREDLFLENGRLGEAEKHGIRPLIVERAADKMQAIEVARAIFPSCDFDEVGCTLGVKRLRQYRKEYDEMREVWRDRPRHDENSHGADGFMTFACGYTPPSNKPAYKPKRRGAWAL